MRKIKIKLISIVSLVIVSITLFSCGQSTPDDMREVYLKEDQKKVTDHPDVKTDSVSTYLKDCVNGSLSGIMTDELKYYTKEDHNAIMVIVKVGDMKGIEKSSRKELLFAVEDCLKQIPHCKNMEIYIDVEGKYNTLLVKTPSESDLNGKFANEDLLLTFYGKSVIPNKDKDKK